MFVKNNHMANQLYVNYTKNIRTLSQSARRLSTGEKVPTLADGGGEVGTADRWQAVIRGTDKLVSGMESAASYLNTQDEILRQATEVVQRMNELAASALDTSKNTADRLALDAEFQALENEFSQLYQKQYNSVSLFGRSLSVRVGIPAGDTLVLSSISLAAITFGSMTLSQLTNASAALISLTSRIGSLNILKAQAGNNSNEVSRTIDFTRQFTRNLSASENVMRNIDLAIESGNFTKQQVLLSASQSVLAQSNGIVQSALQFLG